MNKEALSVSSVVTDSDGIEATPTRHPAINLSAVSSAHSQYGRTKLTLSKDFHLSTRGQVKGLETGCIWASLKCKCDFDYVIIPPPLPRISEGFSKIRFRKFKCFAVEEE
ncbi:hypothetical protein CEXT_148141 [Caerostris extrusa]|uniref:Uncharacterized protein n=1 Tax=Caerostris extrusa TaxID=172846 RepID=A0AAV4S7G8_CAEEX|nr:hypothetical protein CEXT_148141 [Caerostris extrusa]